MNTEPRVTSAFSRRTPLVALLLALGLGAVACGQQLTPAAQPDPAVQPVSALGTATPASLPPPIHTAELPPAPVPATFDVAALAEKVKPMVVNITTTQKVDVPGGMMGNGPDGADPFEFFFGQRGGAPHPQGPTGPRERSMKRQALGTGFIIDSQGYVVTNEHVIHDADDVRVHLNDEREFDADVVGRDPKLDIALLHLRGAKDLPAAPLGSSEQLRVGEYVLAVGNPFGLGHTVTLGIVSAKARSIGAGPYDDFIQTDASINPGNSGGPLFNWRGEVVGINAAIRAGANGIGFAIPVDAAKDILPQLREKGHVERGRLGLAFQPMTSDLATGLGVDGNRGALVSEVEPGGSAARAGIKSGDVVLAVNGTPIAHAEELPRRVAVHAPGTAIKLTVLHDKQQREIAATLDAMPDDDVGAPPRPAHPTVPSSVQPVGKLGIQITDAPGGGVRVDDVRDPNNVRDLTPGDVIVELNRVPVKEVVGLRAEMNKLKPGSTAIFKVRRGKQSLYAAVPVPAK
ncbi:MAG: Do family serine endopeptidase [Byssovorax sp.]